MSIEDKHRIVYISNRHYYDIDLTIHNFDLENSTPLYLNVEGFEIYENAWTNLLFEIIQYLIDEFEFSKEELLDFKLEWSNAKLFTEKTRTNYRALSNGLYVNCNHTALHSCWVIQDFINFCGIWTLTELPSIAWAGASLEIVSAILETSV